MNNNVSKYIDRSIEVCWLMAIQDPPMLLYNMKSDHFDSAKYRDYQTRGSYTAYVVWPAIAVSDGGPLLSKGVAEGTNKCVSYGTNKSIIDVTSTARSGNVRTQSKADRPGSEEPRRGPKSTARSALGDNRMGQTSHHGKGLKFLKATDYR